MTDTVTLPRSVVEQALAALKYEKDANNPLDWHHDRIMDSLRAALEQPQVEQEPIGEAQDWNNSQKYTHCIWDARVVPMGTKLYTHPQPTRQPLTDELIDKIADGMPGGLDGFMKGWGWRQFARAVEAHGIGGEE